MNVLSKWWRGGSGQGRMETASTVPVHRSVIPSAPDAGDARLEPRIREIGGTLLDAAQKHKGGVFSAKFYADKLMSWSMKDKDFKVQLFRFVDTFPVLRGGDEVHEHLVDYLTQPGVTLPPGMDLGLRAGGAAKGLFTKTMSAQIKTMAGQFIAGTDAASALPKLKDLWGKGIAFSVDLLGEVCVSDAEADEYQARYLDLIRGLPDTVREWKETPRLERDHLGVVPRTNVSVKLGALSARLNPAAPGPSVEDAMKRLIPIAEAAREHGVFINFDMEHAALKEITLRTFFAVRERVDFEAGIAMQAYLRSGVDDARRVVDWAKSKNRAVTVRLVKGAYWDQETIHAEEMGWPTKVWSQKWETDACFERMSEVFLDACPIEAGQGGVKLALGSHNARSIAAALAYAESKGLPKEAIELQMLHGMADELKLGAGDEKHGLGLRVREYVPVGEMIPGMAYLVRRLLENTSNESWLLANQGDAVGPDQLLAPPGPRVGTGAQGHAIPTLDALDAAPERHGLSPTDPHVGDGRPFFNEALRDLSFDAEQQLIADGIEKASVPVVANDRTPDDASRMVGEALEAFPGWRDTDARVRANLLVEVAAAMRARRDELTGVIIRENGKPWADADADVCEAIDFCEYYARFAPSLFDRKRLGLFVGELDEMWHQPRGIAAVISPWNFPLAICCGMTAAAIVTGNTVVLKPAEQTPGIALIMADMFADALRRRGHDERVLRFCPAPGETTGAALVRDPRVSIIAFTGSKAVGLDILKTAGDTREADGQTHVKRVVCEMGGKNAVIVDASADLDEAVLGVRQSAFGFSGQKCSAASRCVVVDPEGPEGGRTKLFVERLVESSKALVLGNPMDPGSDIGPVIDEEAAANIRRMIDIARREHAEMGGCDEALAVPELTLPEGWNGHAEGRAPRAVIGPHIFTDVRPEHTIARDEVFGPVLAVMHAATFDEALEIATGHAYRLTGGVFTRKPTHIELAKQRFRVGNLYINRGCTGALVGRQPFGGFGMSGVGSKAGGPDYLMQFVEPRASCENTMRRGFSPEL
jgi:RHH-type proline utilization regulon transcriptional repressor/proline dehydrogenase/delta 1-pyrroline-5-carboxylate dehydrogenase